MSSEKFYNHEYLCLSRDDSDWGSEGRDLRSVMFVDLSRGARSPSGAVGCASHPTGETQPAFGRIFCDPSREDAGWCARGGRAPRDQSVATGNLLNKSSKDISFWYLTRP